MKKEKTQKMPIALKIVVIVLVVLIALMLVLAIVFYSMRASGKKSLYSRVEASQPDLGLFGEVETESSETKNDGDELESTTNKVVKSDVESESETATKKATGEKIPEGETTEVENNASDDLGYVYQAGDISINNHVYRYNKDILTFLVLGIDMDSEVPIVDENTNYLKGGQSDTIFLMVMNPHDKSISIVAVNRNTMTDIDMYDSAGNYVRTAKAQICVQHGYGDGGKLSCERARQTVSELFYNLPINGYVSINVGAVPSLNDAVGGVEITLPADSPELGLPAGTTVRLNGDQAHLFIRYRNTMQFDSATTRLNNQKIYLTAFMNQVYEATKNDITFPVSLYQKLSNYIVTDISVDEMSYLASELLGYSVNNARMYTVPGQTVMGKKFEEFYVDENALRQQMLEIFYEVVK